MPSSVWKSPWHRLSPKNGLPIPPLFILLGLSRHFAFPALRYFPRLVAGPGRILQWNMLYSTKCVRIGWDCAHQNDVTKVTSRASVSSPDSFGRSWLWIELVAMLFSGRIIIPVPSDQCRIMIMIRVPGDSERDASYRNALFMKRVVCAVCWRHNVRNKPSLPIDLVTELMTRKQKFNWQVRAGGSRYF